MSDSQQDSERAGFIILAVAGLVGGLVATVTNGNFWGDALAAFVVTVVVTVVVAGLGVLLLRRLRPRD